MENLLEEIEKGLNNLESDYLFHKILSASENVLNLNDSELAVKMQMSRSTVTRWRSGETSPFPIMRRSVYSWLKRYIMANK